MTAIESVLLFGLSESHTLARRIAAATHLELAPLEERSFEGGEFKLRPLCSVRGRTVCVVQTLASSAGVSVSERLLRLLFLCFGLRDAGAARVLAFVPYLAFARKDRRTQTRDPVSSRYAAQLLECAGIDRLIAIDVHNPAAFDNAFRIPTDHLSAIPLFVDHFARTLDPGMPLSVASPDVGGVKRVQLFREQLERRLQREVELVFIEKRRALGVVSGGTVVGDVTGRTAIVLDDLCASGGTLMRAASGLRAAGALGVHVAFTHAPHPPGLSALAASSVIDGIVMTDSTGAAMESMAAKLRARLTVLSVAPLLGEALSRMFSDRPVSELLTRFPPDEAPQVS